MWMGWVEGRMNIDLHLSGLSLENPPISNESFLNCPHVGFASSQRLEVENISSCKGLQSSGARLQTGYLFISMT